MEFWPGSNFSKYTDKHRSKLEKSTVFIRAWRTQTYTADLYSRCFIFSSCKQASPIDVVLHDPWVWFWGFSLQELSNLTLTSEPAHKLVHNFTLYVIFTQLVLKPQKISTILPPASPATFPPAAMHTNYLSNATERPINHLISQLWF